MKIRISAAGREVVIETDTAIPAVVAEMAAKALALWQATAGPTGLGGTGFAAVDLAADGPGAQAR